MNESYQEVPNIISGKDLDYLSDMFNWNYGAYKSSVNASKSASDSEIKEMLDNASTTFYNTMQSILNILNNEGGQNE